MPHALDGIIVKVDVRHLKTTRDRLGQYREVMILTRDFHLARREIAHRVVAAVMSELEPPRLCSTRERKKLVPKANTHKRNFPKQRLHILNRVSNRRGVSRSIRKKYAIWIAG